MMRYTCVVKPLDNENGGGYAAFFPDLPGCMSDGESPQEAVENALDALFVYTEAQEQRKIDMPEPDSAAAHNEEYVNGLLEEIDELKAKLARTEHDLNEVKQRSMVQTYRVGARQPGFVSKQSVRQTA